MTTMRRDDHDPAGAHSEAAAGAPDPGLSAPQ
jgi:hypothetical protein